MSSWIYYFYVFKSSPTSLNSERLLSNIRIRIEILLNNLFDPMVSFSTLLQLAKCKAYNLHLIICKLQGMNCRVEYVYLWHKNKLFFFLIVPCEKRLYLFRLIIKASKMVTRQALTNAFYLLSSFRLCIGVTKPLEITVYCLFCFCVRFFLYIFMP